MAVTKIRGSTQIQDLSVGNAQIAYNTDIELVKLEDGDKLVKSDGTVPFLAPIAGVMPTLPSHLATKEYVDNVATGLDVKLSVKALSFSDITLSGEQTVDNVALVAGDRVLVVGQTDATQNGIYVVSAGAWVRSEDADNSPTGEVTPGMFTFIESGDQFGGSGWVLTTESPIVLGTTDLEFSQFSQAGVIQAGAGLIKTGTTLDVVSANGGIVVNANDIALTLADNTLEITPLGLKLAALEEGKILIGSVTDVAVAQTVSGDATLAADGVLTISNAAVTTAKIADEAVTTAKIADEAVTLDKLLTLDPAKFVIGSAAGNKQVTLTGDVTVDEDGVVSVDPTKVVRIQDIVTRETPTTADNITFTLAFTPKVGMEHVYVNGLLMDSGASNDYTLSGADITFTWTLEPTDKVRVTYYK